MEFYCKNTKDSKPFEETSEEQINLPSVEDGKASPAEIKKYLNEVSSVVNGSSDLVLKKEYQRLTDLLSSYSRITDKLREETALSSNRDNRQPSDNKCYSSKRTAPLLPEIYAVLCPDLYEDIREEEKNRFITKFSKKRTYKVLPSTVSLPYISKNLREIEKERLCKLIAATPARFHNIFDGSTSSKPFKNPSYSLPRNPRTFKVEDVREKEKDRLAKIFAGSSIVVSKSIQKSKEKRHLDFKLDLLEEDDTLSAEKSMVRVGEYSPLNGQQRGKTTLGIGEHDELRKQLEEERKREFINSVAAQRQKKERSVSHSDRNETNHVNTRPRMSSASTQTDSEESSTSYLDNQAEIDSPILSVNSSPSRRAPLEFSPREKLLSDLHGSVPMTHYQITLCEKEKQAAYAKALRAQIEEKKRLDEERKRKEKEEEELIERRVREQAERLHREYLKEQNKKYDWIQQKQAQEEILRRKMEELELQSIELKKQDKQKKLQKNTDFDKNQYKFSSRGEVLQKHSAASQPSAFTFHSPVPASHRELQLPRTTFTKSPMLEVAPLLDSDQQNILSVKASEIRRDYNDFNKVDALRLEPGVNLLSPQYNARDNGITTTPFGNESMCKMANTPFEGHGQKSARIVSKQKSSSPLSTSKRFSPLSDQPSVLTQNNQQPPSKRPSSPVVPALQTDMLLKKSPKVLDDKRMVLPKPIKDFKETTPKMSVMKKESVESRNILTQLGEFRRKLAMEHQLLEQRLMHNNS